MVTDKLAEQVRRKLNITWDDTETDARVAEIIESTIPYLLHKLGIVDLDFDFSAPSTENMLFLACCLYEWNHMSRDEFEENYHRTIAEVRDQHTVLYHSTGGGNDVTINNQDKIITENGIYTADEGHTGLGTVAVSVVPKLQAKVTTENGEVTPDAGFDGLEKVTVNLDLESKYNEGYAEGRENGYADGKADGESLGYSDALSKRTDLVVTENGEYAPTGESTGFKSVSVTVPEKVPTLQNKTITENGTYTADSGYTGLGTVTVEVASGGGGDIDALIDHSITEVNSGVTTIGGYIFYYCYGLTRANFPNATTINTSAFHGCTSLTSVNLPNVTTIYRNTFHECRALTSVTLPKVTSVNQSTFYDCNALKSVDLPEATNIGSSVFYNCYVLTAIILRSETMCTISGVNSFDKCYHILGTKNSTYNPNGDKDGYIYVPRALLSDDDATKDYRRATNWSTFASQFRALEDYTVDGTITGDLDPTKI